MVSDLGVEKAVWYRAAAAADAVAGGVDTARAAGRDALPDGAFGVLCSGLLLPVYQLVAGVEDTMLVAAAGAVRTAAANLRLVADELSGADVQVASDLRDAGPW